MPQAGERGVEGGQELRLLLRATRDEVLGEHRPRARIDIREPGREHLPLLVTDPLREHDVDERGDARIPRTRGIGLRNDQLGNGGDSFVLVGRERVQCPRMRAFVDGPTHREQLIGERGRPGEHEQHFTPVHQSSS